MVLYLRFFFFFALFKLFIGPKHPKKTGGAPGAPPVAALWRS